MPECPVCFGAGELDFRDMDAVLSEHFPIERLGIISCPECDGAGEVDEERLKDLLAAARARVDQVIAGMHERGEL